MSRIGKQAIPVPGGVKVAVNAASRTVSIQGPKGSLNLVHRPEVTVSFDESAKAIRCAVDNEALMEVGGRRAHWGTTRANLRNMVEGVTKGYSHKLEIVGVGWSAKAQGKKLVLKLGYADDIECPIPDGVKVDIDNNVNLTISGCDRQIVGQLAARIRAFRKPEPYQGKGVKYATEVIQRKQGKAFGA